MRATAVLGIFGILLGNAVGQDWHLLSTLGVENTMVHDPVRDRVVMFAHTGDGPGLLEWDGASWLQTWLVNGPPAAPARVPKLAYDQARRETVLLLDYRTWRYDGAAWQLAAVNGPGGIGTFHDNSRSVTAFDEQRRLVIYYDATFGRTSEWDGSSWRTVQAQMGLLTSPWAFLGYDPVRQQIVGFTPLPGGAFAWDGTAWSQIPEGPRPPAFPQRNMAVCTDPVRNRLLGFGGVTASGAQGNTLWEWSGGAWTSLTTGPSMYTSTMARQVGSGQLVLFGYAINSQNFETWGYDTSFHLLEAAPCLGRTVTDAARQRIVGVTCPGSTSASLQDTWEWDGAFWRHAAGPHPTMTGLVFDGSRGGVVGIESNLSQPNVRTWFWTGGTWQRQFPPIDPPWQPGQALCHDPVRGVLVMFGFAGTWEWDGVAWQQAIPAHAPFLASSVAPASAVYDPGPGLVRLLLTAPSGIEEWTWDGIDWSQASTTGLPQLPYFELSFDARSGRVLLVAVPRNGTGGTWARVGNSWQLVSSTVPASLSMSVDPFTGVLRSWQQGTWSGFTAAPATAVQYGTGCGGGTPWLAALGRPSAIDDHLRFDLGRAPATAPAALFASLTPDNTPLGGGCTLLLGQAVHCGAAVTSVGGAASFPMPIPDLPSLLGLDVFWQGAALQAGGPLLGVATLSNGAHARLGD